MIVQELELRNSVRMNSKDFERMIEILSLGDKTITLRTKKDDLEAFELYASDKSLHMVIVQVNNHYGVEIKMQQSVDEVFPAR